MKFTLVHYPPPKLPHSFSFVRRENSSAAPFQSKGTKIHVSDTKTKRLASSEYWDERYAEVRSAKQVHEWFRTFDDLEPFFGRHLS